MQDKILKKQKNRIGMGMEIIILLLSTVSILALSDYGITQINIGSGLMFMLVCLNRWYYKQHKEKTFRLASLIGATLGTLSLSVGNILRDLDGQGLGRNVGITDLIFAVGMICFLYQLMQNLFAKLTHIRLEDEYTCRLSKKQCFLLTAGIVVLWLPYYLTFFPGIFGSDPIESIRMGTQGVAWTNHHPVLYTVFLKVFIRVWEPVIGLNGAMGVMTLVQQFILAGSFVSCFSFLLRRGVSKKILGAIIVFIAFNPVIAVFSVYATKDVLFACAVLLLVLKLFRLQELDREDSMADAGFWTGFLINAFFVVFLRNNGSFLVVLTVLYLMVKYRKEWKTLAMILLFLLCCIGVQKMVLFPILGVQEGSFAESLSIPLQQIGQTVVDGGEMTEQQAAYVEQLLPIERIKQVYQAGYTDPIKFDAAFHDAALNQDKMKFLQVWLGMLPHNLGSYVKAYLLQTAGYWDINQTDSLTIYGVIDNEIGLRQTDILEEISGYSLQPVMEKLILICRKLPVLCYLTNMAMLLFASFLAAYLLKRKKVGVSWLMPLWIGWLTIMLAAPASCKFRYMLPLYMTLPFILWVTTRYGFDNVDKTDEEENTIDL